MTNSLLLSYLWYKNCPFDWKEQAYLGLQNTIKGEYQLSEAAIRGIQYEDKINTILKTGQEFSSEEQMFEILRGSVQQGWIKPLKIPTPSGTYEFRGRYDYKKDNHIYDLKTTPKPIKPEYYSSGFQHIIYMLAERIYDFSYLVTRLDPRFHVVDFQQIDVHLDKEVDESRLIKALIDFEMGLKELNLWDDYLQYKCGWRV